VEALRGAPQVWQAMGPGEPAEEPTRWACDGRLFSRRMDAQFSRRSLRLLGACEGERMPRAMARHDRH